jgi:GAF domain-containing protein
LLDCAAEKSGICEIITEPGSANAGLLAGHFDWLDQGACFAVLPVNGREDWLALIVCVCNRQNIRAKSGMSEKDKELLNAVGRQISVSLEEARLYKETLDKTMELTHKIETIQVMNNIDKSILSSLQPQEILETDVSLIPQVVSCDRAAVNIADKKKGGFFVKDLSGHIS